MDIAEEAIECLKTKTALKEAFDGFRIKKVFRLFKPRLWDKMFWVDGFDTYTY